MQAAPSASLLIILTLSAILLHGCVSKQAYSELQRTKAFYEAEALQADSLRRVVQRIREDKQASDVALQRVTNDFEQLAAANKNLNESYRRVLQQYQQLLEQNENTLSAASARERNLQEALGNQIKAVDEQQSKLTQLEYELSREQSRLQSRTYSESEIAYRDARIKQLENKLKDRKLASDELLSWVRDAMRNFNSQDIEVQQRNERVYITFGQKLLYSSGSHQINPSGQPVLQKLCWMLAQHPRVQVVVEGHADADGNADKNWDLSVMRATAVVKEMTRLGLDPKRLIAAGRGEQEPLAGTNGSSQANRRTEIILSLPPADPYPAYNPK